MLVGSATPNELLHSWAGLYQHSEKPGHEGYGALGGFGWEVG